MTYTTHTTHTTEAEPRWRYYAREVLLDLAVLIWPVHCMGCGTPDRELCSTCRIETRDRLGAFPIGSTHASDHDWLAAGPYDGVLRSLIIGLKHADRIGYAAELGYALSVPLAAALATCRGPDPPIVVTVPSRRSREWERGYRHVELIARRALRILRVSPTVVPVANALLATRGRTGQVGLDPAQRRANASRVRVKSSRAGRLAGRDVILVDDIITTGATLAAAEHALIEAGARQVRGVAVCAVTKGARQTKQTL